MGNVDMDQLTEMCHMNGIQAFLEVLVAGETRYLFGNPGSTELPLSDALATDPRLEYILSLHELPLLAMADGYAMASGRLGVACVHISGGLGNAMGMIFNAYREGTPLLIMAGQQDRRLRFQEPAMESDMVAVARPWTKWAAEVSRVEDVPAAVRRAAQVALTPPTGPVFLALPVDVQLESAEGLDLRAPRIPDRRVRPSAEALAEAAALLVAARAPAILAGSRVTEAGGVAELTQLAERLGAPVFAEMQTSHGRLPIAADHPLYAGILPQWAPDIQRPARRVRRHPGGRDEPVARAGLPRPDQAIPDQARLIQLDANPWELGKNYPVEVGLLGDPKTGLAELAERVTGLQTTEHVQAAAAHAARPRLRSARPTTPHSPHASRPSGMPVR